VFVGIVNAALSAIPAPHNRHPRRKGEVGLGALLVGAERVPELDELQAQDIGPEVVRHDPLRDLSPPFRPPGCCAP
jgi:hypothetical protein